MRWSEIIVLLHIPILFALLGAGAQTIYSNPENFQIQNFHPPIIFPFFSIFGFLIFLKFLIFHFQQKWKTEILRKFRINRILGFLGITVVSLGSRILVFFLETKVLYLLTVCTLFLSILSYFLFGYRIQKYCRLTQKMPKIARNFLIFYHISILVISVFLAGELFKKLDHLKISLFQVGCFALPFAGTHEICSLIFGKLELKEKFENSDVEMENLETEEPEKEPLRLECKICSESYTESSRIPRILKECGHTVCQECVQKLLNSQRNHIFCPFCMRATVVTGSADSLPKNYEALEMLDWQKN